MPVIHSQPPGKPFVQIGHAERMVDPAGLTAQQKRLLWAGIKSSDPALAVLLKEDQNLQKLQQHFNATIRFTVDDFNHYLQAGLSKLEENNHA